MRTLIHVALLAGLLPVAGFAGSAYGADLDPYYEPAPPPPVAVVPPPPPVVVVPRLRAPIAVLGPRPCGFYRPCFRPYARGYFGPARFYPRPYAYRGPVRAPVWREGYGYRHDRFDQPRTYAPRYGYDRPREDYGETRRYERRERVERYEGGRNYGDPRDDDRRRGERFDRGPGYGPEPYDRG